VRCGPRLIVTLFLATVGTLALPAQTLPQIARFATDTLCRDESTGNWSVTMRFEGRVSVVRDASMPDSLWAETLAMLLRVNTLTAPTALFEAQTGHPSTLTVYYASTGRERAIAAGFNIPSNGVDGYNSLWSTNGVITRACVWINSGLTPKRRAVALAHELTQVLGPSADALDPRYAALWLDSATQTWLSPVEQLTVLLLYRRLVGGLDADSTYRNALAALQQLEVAKGK
jgi:hypothetical protein